MPLSVAAFTGETMVRLVTSTKEPEPGGFDTAGMPGFFERLQKATRLYENNAPTYLRTHPLVATISPAPDNVFTSTQRLRALTPEGTQPPVPQLTYRRPGAEASPAAVPVSGFAYSFGGGPVGQPVTFTLS